MSSTNHRTRRRLASLVGAAALAAGTLAVVATPASAAETVDDATFTWGLSGYAQDGIFGPWTFSAFTGDAEYLQGDVSGANANPQTEYTVDPVPATSFPTSKAGKKPNAVKFTGGDGTVDRSTGAAELSWTGSYTVNAYPVIYNAPNEIYSDPELTVEPDGSGELTFEFSIGAGVTMGGDPFERKDFGRLTLATFDAGSLSAKSLAGYRVTPDYQGVEWTAPEGVTAQNRTCTTAGGGTGWWGAWPTEFLDAISSHESGKSVAAHFYSTGCGGKQDNKPQLPFDVTFPADEPTVTVSDTEIVRGGTSTVTVTGTGFDPSLATGTRPPFAGKKSGVYIAFGRYADVWKPSAGAASSARANADSGDVEKPAVVWAVPAASFEGSAPAQDPSAPNYTELKTDGTFEAEIPVNEEWLDDKTGNYGIYTYTGGGAVVPSYETATPLTFVDPTATVSRTGASVKSTRTTTGTANAKVTTNGPAAPAGTVHATFKNGSTTLTGPKTDLGADGTAKVTIPKASKLGSWTFAIHYTPAEGDPHAAATGGGATVKIAQYAASVTRPSSSKPTTKATGRSSVVVKSSSPAKPTGSVRAILVKGKTAIFGTAVKIDANGKANVVIPKTGSKGTWTYFVRYYGDANHAKKDGTRSSLSITK